MKQLIAIALAGALLLGACGGDDDDGNDVPGSGTLDTGGAQQTTPGSGGGVTPAATTGSSLPVESDGNAPGIPPISGDIQELTATSPYDNSQVTMTYIDEAAGTGEALGVIDASVCEADPNSAPTVTVHYTGWLTDGTKFDSSVDRGSPAQFPLCGVIPGWTIGVGTMNVGGKRRLIIPAGLAYGPQGRPPTIPGGATLIFDVEVLSSP
jgi:hypothetical protein